MIDIYPGGRFREQYYWDSFWIVEGLLESELFDIANATLQNFMDELDTIGFIPNGGRIYCTLSKVSYVVKDVDVMLNRSQPFSTAVVHTSEWAVLSQIVSG